MKVFGNPIRSMELISLSYDEGYTCNDGFTSNSPSHIATNYYEFYDEKKHLIASVQVCDTHATDAYAIADLIIETQ